MAETADDNRPQALPMTTVPGWPMWPIVVAPMVLLLILEVCGRG